MSPLHPCWRNPISPKIIFLNLLKVHPPQFYFLVSASLRQETPPLMKRVLRDNALFKWVSEFFPRRKAPPFLQVVGGKYWKCLSKMSSTWYSRHLWPLSHLEKKVTLFPFTLTMKWVWVRSYEVFWNNYFILLVLLDLSPPPLQKMKNAK